MISLIYASSLNGVIGRNGNLPWRLSADLRRFKRLTAGGCLVMGRRTWESLGGKPLPGRSHVVLTRDLPPSIVDLYDDAAVLHVSTGDVQILCRDIFPVDRPTWIIGGASVFAQFLPYVDAVHWTRVDAEVEGDTVFSFRPDLGPAWRMVGVEEVVPADAENEHPSAYMLFERR